MSSLYFAYDMSDYAQLLSVMLKCSVIHENQIHLTYAIFLRNDLHFSIDNDIRERLI